MKHAEKEKKPEPMTMMRNREREIDLMFPLPYRKPSVTLGQIDKAATAVAEWENSDPFAYGRTALHVRQGYLDPAVLVKEMTQRTIARRVAKAREVDNEKL